MTFTSCFPPRIHTRNRPGRLLVECLVAMLLLHASALVVVGMARGASATTQAANSTSAALAAAVRGAETSIAQPCPTTSSSGTDAIPLGRVSWTERALGRARERDIQVELTSSALTGAHNTTLSLRATRLCE